MNDLPVGWTALDLAECADWYSGGTPDTSNPAFWNGDIPWITSSSLHNFYLARSERQLTKLGLDNGSRLMPENTIIFVVRGMSLKTEFRLGITRKPVAFGQDCKALIAKNDIDPWYLAYAIKAKSQEILGMVDEAGHGTGRLQTEVLKQLEISIPPLHEQERIARSIRLFDDKIELNRRMNRTLESMAQALFRKWFVENEDVEGWDIRRFNEISEISRDSVNPGRFPDEVFYHYSIPAYDENHFPVREMGNQIKSAKFIVPIECVMISKLNPRIRRVWLPFKLDGRSICSTEYLVNLPKKYFSSEFLFGLLSSQPFQDRFISMITGTSGSHQRVKAEYVLDMDVQIPPKKLVGQYTETVKPLLQKAQQNILESRTLTSLRDTLLPKLMRGEVRVAS